MRKLVIIFATLVVGSLILSAGSSAQRRGMSGERMYNPQTVTRALCVAADGSPYE